MTGHDPAHSDTTCLLQMAFGRAVPTTPIPVAEGQGARSMALALDGEGLPPRVIVHRYRPSQQARAWRAFTAMQALREQRFPVPEIYYFGWSHYTRYVVLLMEYVEGRGDEGQPGAFFYRVGPHFAQTLASLHQIAWKRLPDLPVWPFRLAFNDAARRVRRLESGDLTAILGWLVPQIAQIVNLPQVVIHGDYALSKIVANRTEVGAVLGWEQASLADPRFDVGYTSAALSVYGVAFSDQFIEDYQQAAGPLMDRVFWEVFGALRLLVAFGERLARLPQEQMEAALDEIGPAWEGLLQFVEARTGLRL
jgi:aminoglycoside phosphotransferase (APT) family kinase protein